MLVYAATDAIITRNILKAVRSSTELHTFQRQDDDIYSLLVRLSFATGIPVPPHCRQRVGAASPQYSPASPVYSDFATPPPSVSPPSAARVVAPNGAGSSTAPAPDKVEPVNRWLAEEQSAAVAVGAAGVAGSPTAVRHSDSATAPAPGSSESGVKRRRSLWAALAKYRREYG